MGWPTTTVAITNLLTASSTCLGSISTAAGGTITAFTSVTLDQPRRISITCSTMLGPSFTLTGIGHGGMEVTETIATSTTVGSAGTTTQDFIQVTSITQSCAFTNSSGGASIGTTSNAGTVWKVFDTTRDPPYLGFTLTPASSLTQTSFEFTNDYPAYDPVSNVWTRSASPTRGPQPNISSMGSSVIGPGTTQGYINFPVAAWRITLSASSSGIGILRGLAEAPIFEPVQYRARGKRSRNAQKVSTRRCR